MTTNTPTKNKSARKIAENQKDSMFGIPLSDWLTYTNAAYLLSLLLTFLLTATLWRVSVASQNASNFALEQYKSDAAVAVAEANAQAQAANEAAAKAYLRAQTIYKSLAWRALSDAQVQRITAAFKSTQLPILVNYVESDPEALYFASYLFSCARGSEPSKSIDFLPATMDNSFFFGLRVSGPNTEEFKSILKIFDALSISYEYEVNPNGITMRVGIKPQALLDDQLP